MWPRSGAGADQCADTIDQGERRCVFALVSDPCVKRREMQPDASRAECFRAEQAICDDLVNRIVASGGTASNEGEMEKRRDIQRASIATRDTACQFYYDTMETTMIAGCLARETGRRALLLRPFSAGS